MVLAVLAPRIGVWICWGASLNHQMLDSTIKGYDLLTRMGNLKRNSSANRPSQTAFTNGTFHHLHWGPKRQQWAMHQPLIFKLPTRPWVVWIGGFRGPIWAVFNLFRLSLVLVCQKGSPERILIIPHISGLRSSTNRHLSIVFPYFSWFKPLTTIVKSHS